MVYTTQHPVKKCWMVTLPTVRQTARNTKYWQQCIVVIYKFHTNIHYTIHVPFTNKECYQHVVRPKGVDFSFSICTNLWHFLWFIGDSPVKGKVAEIILKELFDEGIASSFQYLKYRSSKLNHTMLSLIINQQNLFWDLTSHQWASSDETGLSTFCNKIIKYILWKGYKIKWVTSLSYLDFSANIDDNDKMEW